jgi:hypothetical protein
LVLTPEIKKRIQLFLIALFVLAGIRVWMIMRTRSAAEAPPRPPVEGALDPDYYVTPKKLHAYDLKSARALTQQPVWVREGYRYYFYPYDPERKRSDFKQEAGLLGPIEKLQVNDVVLDASPGNPDQKQVMAVFEKDGKSFAFPVGAVRAGNYQLYIDEILYLQDPRDLYKHWPAETWQAIENHEVREGMNELQAAFSIGMGVPRSSNESGVKTVVYPRGGNETTVTYRDGRAAEIQQAQARQ